MEGVIVMRRVAVFFGVLLVCLSLVGPALAASAQPAGRDLVVLSGDAVVPAGETVRTVVAFDGRVTVDGRVTESVVSFHGPVMITGSVGKDVVVFDGVLTVAAGARLGGNVFAQRPLISSQATVSGSVYSVAAIWRTADWVGWVGAIVLWLAIAVSVLVLGLALLWMAPRAADATFAAGRSAAGPSIAWGLAAFIGLPILGVMAIATVIGLPLGLGILFGLVLLLAIGQTAGAWLLGRSIVHEPTGRIPAFLAGWAILSGISLIPGVGALVWFGSTVFGLGAMSVAMWRARHGGPVAVADTPPMPAAAPVHV